MSHISLQGLHVRRYKNLRSVYVPWADGVAIFGVNGAGKTNLLECLALLTGTARTVQLSRDRLLPGSDDLALDVLVDAGQLPVAPDEVLPLASLPIDSAHEIPGLVRARVDADWWRAIGALGGGDFAAGLAASVLPQELVAFLSQLVEQPVIRYTLEHVDLAPNEKGRVPRRFRRTLLTQNLPLWLRQLAPDLPDEFAPLRTALSEGHDGSDGGWPLVALPGPWEPPVTVEWLSRARSSAEAWDDLLEQFEHSAMPADAIADCLQELDVVKAADPDPFWLRHLVAADAINEDLSLVLPYLSARAVGEDAADLAIDDRRDRGLSVERARTSAHTFLEPFSAGERRWVDEAVATAARALRAQGDRWEWQARVLTTMDHEVLIGDLLSIADEVDADVRAAGWLTAEAMRKLLGAVENKLVAEMRARLASQDFVARAWDEAVNPDVLALRGDLTVRVFDEPEEHLHPAAQRKIAEALERLRLRGSHVVITSHSPHFLGLPSWRLVHAQLTDEGATVSPLASSDLDARKALAGQMGLTRGELLAQVGYVLIVEGEGDRYVLDKFYGERLRDAGVAMLRMHGTGNLLATAEMDFVQQYLDAPIGILLDYTRLDLVNGSTPTSDLESEEQQLRHLRRACRKRKRRYDEFGLDRPDIVAYFDADLIREQTPGFAGWSLVLQQYRKIEQRPSFKKWLRDKHGVDLVGLEPLRQVASETATRGLRLRDELEKVVSAIERAAAAGAWPATAPNTKAEE